MLISGRVHPSENITNYVIEELINLIIKEQEPSLVHYIILPMLNPDGVILGNYRTDFSGIDLN